MDTVAWIVVIVCAAVVVAAVAFALWSRRRRTHALMEGFGPEYDRTVSRSGSRTRGERELDARRKRVESLRIRELSQEDSERLRLAWRDVQARFVDDPESAIGEADRLIAEVMQMRGYPVGDFEQRAADISVDHADVVAHYRSGHAIAQRRERGEDVNTEDLRQAMVHYRELFEELAGGRRPMRRAG